MAASKQTEDTFRRGDKVRLMSDGPDMMVMGLEQLNGIFTGKLDCIWFLRKDDSWEGPFEAAFYPELLEDA